MTEIANSFSAVEGQYEKTGENIPKNSFKYTFFEHWGQGSNGNPKATIISWYSPTNVNEETELVTFHEELSSLVRNIPKLDLLVIGGDMNAQIGKKQKQQMQPSQHVKSEWTTSNWFHYRK